MITLYQSTDGRQFTDYQAFQDHQAAGAAAQAAFDARFGERLSTPEGRHAVIEGLRAGALEKSGIVRVTPPSPKYKGGLSEAEVTRRVDVAATGVTNRHGAEVFALPTQAASQTTGEILPPGMTRVSFFGGMPER